MAFEKLYNAKRWLEVPNVACEIWEAHAGRAFKPEIKYFPNTRWTLTDYEAGRFWEDFNNNIARCRQTRIPTGTLFCTSLKLIKKVE